MRRTILLFAFLISISLSVLSQTMKEKICSHSWQQKSSIIWDFTEHGKFSALLFWSNKTKFGFTLKHGSYNLNDSTKLLNVTFDSTYSIYATDSTSVSKDIGLQQWHLITVSENKMILSRPPLWEFEKRNAVGIDQEIVVTLTNDKKKRGR